MLTPVFVADRAGHPEWGSDLIMDMLRLLGIEYAAVLPGSTFRGIHDSAVNYTANRGPELILCNHEMITVSLARGYYRATGRPMAAMVHKDDAYGQLVLSATTEPDAAKRKQVYSQLNDYLLDQSFTFAFAWYPATALVSSKVHGLEFSGSAALSYANAWLE